MPWIFLKLPSHSLVETWKKKYSQQALRLFAPIVGGYIVLRLVVYQRLAALPSEVFDRIDLNAGVARFVLITLPFKILKKTSLILQWARIKERSRTENKEAWRAHSEAGRLINATVIKKFPELYEQLVAINRRFFTEERPSGSIDPKALSQLWVNAGVAMMLGTMFSAENVAVLSRHIQTSMDNPKIKLVALGWLGTHIFRFMADNKQRSEEMIAIISRGVQHDLKNQETLAGKIYAIWEPVVGGEEAKDMVVMYFVGLIQAAAHTAVVPLTHGIVWIANMLDRTTIQSLATQIRSACSMDKNIEHLMERVPALAVLTAYCVNWFGPVVADPIRVEKTVTVEGITFKGGKTIWLALGTIAREALTNTLEIDPSTLSLTAMMQAFEQKIGSVSEVFKAALESIVFKWGFNGQCIGNVFACHEILWALAAFITVCAEMDLKLQVLAEPDPGVELMEVARNGRVGLL